MIASTSPLAAQGADSGSVTGKVLNATSGEYLNRARVAVQGTSLETFTAPDGSYHLSDVPAGTTTVTVFYTGLEPMRTNVTVPRGGTVQQDFNLTRKSAEDGRTVVMEDFIVAASREMNALSIALNEQRFAGNVKNVVSTEEFGDIGENNIGEFVKFIPGVSVNYSGGIIATDIAVRGFPSSGTLVSMDGSEVATAGAVNPNRQFDLNGFPSLNNISRVEVLKTPTPDLPASMLGGSVNLVTRSAFERTKPRFAYRIGATWNNKTSGLRYPGPRDEKVSTLGPSLDFNYVAPVNQKWGYTISGAYSSRLIIHNMGMSTWDMVNPRLLVFSMFPSPQIRSQGSLGATVDHKISAHGVLSGSLSYAEGQAHADTYTTQTGTGNAAVGNETFAQSTGTTGSALTRSAVTPFHDQTWHGALKFRHNGPVWKLDGNTYYSSATNKRRTLEKGALTTVTAQMRTPISVRFDDITSTGPGRISATNATGGRVDLLDISSYTLNTAQDFRRNAWAVKTGGQFNASRRFNPGVPLEVKTGVYYNKERRDVRQNTINYTFVGPDRIANNNDNAVGLYDFIAEVQSSLPGPYGTPQNTYLSHYKIAQYLQSHPAEFTVNDVATYQASVSGSNRITETISAAYMRGDARLFQNRLWVVAGVRFERTEDDGVGPLNDTRALFQQDANGNLIRDAQGRPIRVTGDALTLARLQFKERGAANTRSYDDFYPSFNATYSITENLLARAAYARTIGRPNYVNIIPGVTVSDPTAANPTITVNNTGLLPWTADAYDLALEWYFGGTNLVSVGVFRKDVKDFFGSVRTAATAELLAEFGLSDDYIGYDLATRSNVGDAQMSGFEFSYRHALTFLPAWARGVHVFANGTFLDLEGSTLADFTGYAKRNVNYGVSLTRPRFSIRLNWATNGGVRGNALAAGATVPAGSYFFTPARDTLDANVEIRLHRRWSLYATARNLTDTGVRRLRVGPGVPAHAQVERYNEPGAFVTFGVKGEF